MPTTPHFESQQDHQLHRAWQEWKIDHTTPSAALVGKVLAAQRDNLPVKKIARVLYKALRKNGYHRREIVCLTTELIGLLTSELRNEHDKASYY